MKNIAVDVRMLESSGIGTVLKNILKRAIPAMPDIKFSLLGTPEVLEKYSYLTGNNLEVIACKSPIYSIKEQFEIVSKIPHNTDLLWVPHYNIPVFYRGKILVTVHDVFHLAMPQFVDGVLKKTYAHFMFNAVAKKASHIVCVSHFTKSELHRFTNVPLEKVSVTYNGVDKYWQAPLQAEERIFKNPYILYVGNVKPHKNLKVLVQAFNNIMGAIPHSLVIVGKKEGFITGDKDVASLASKAENRIFFTGYVSDESLKNYYRYADLLVFPSLYEGFGLPPLEAIAAGCKNVLCSDIPVLKEIYGQSLSYFSPDNVRELCDAIIQGINNSIPNDAKKLCNKYSWDKAASQYIELFQNV
jgi:glycosyltransferase involved in cell wall biosynthesis